MFEYNIIKLIENLYYVLVLTHSINSIILLIPKFETLKVRSTFCGDIHYFDLLFKLFDIFTQIEACTRKYSESECLAIPCWVFWVFYCFLSIRDLNPVNIIILNHLNWVFSKLNLLKNPPAHSPMKMGFCRKSDSSKNDCVVLSLVNLGLRLTAKLLENAIENSNTPGREVEKLRNVAWQKLRLSSERDASNSDILPRKLSLLDFPFLFFVNRHTWPQICPSLEVVTMKISSPCTITTGFTLPSFSSSSSSL